MPSVLAVHSIGHPPVSRNALTEVLNVEGTLESGGKETAEWSNERRENRHDQDMEVVGRIWKRLDVSPKLQDTEFSR